MGTASCIGHGKLNGLSVSAAPAFIAYLADVILSLAKNRDSSPSAFAGRRIEVVHSVQHHCEMS